MTAFYTGFWLGISLVLAIGAQNAFVLRQGLRRHHVFWVCLTCAASDAILITVGVYGFATLSGYAPWLAPVMRWAGAAFLFVYGAMALTSAIKGTSSLRAEDAQLTPLKTTIMTVLALTWLNPHVYLDTVMLLGSIALRYEGQENAFAAGAVLSSFVFFFSLGYGARILTPFFEKPLSWRILDVFICLVMWSIALGLIVAG